MTSQPAELLPYDGTKRPTGSNADEWAVFLEEHGVPAGRKEFIAVQIAGAWDDVEKRYMSAVQGRQEFRDAYRKERVTK